ncbi:multinuclear nonheme iron-dependent oxidase [Pontibacter chinhatensis]|uniref:Xylose isomerase-like TIM barrel n=1 Tax=Pontibacter chinhatensis TaxID=1436961 RepID=A0A1I2Z4X8_9BACT|nr:DUF692 family multinuclear iron-containing protein [Pontibacter chinhatensis]SFH32546.1 Protein of unknown function [Pontibacter chinhatensis]
MPGILATVACNLDADILSATYPLLEEGRVEAMEWSFDTLFQVEQLPDWFREMLLAYSREGRLIGHGVFYSLISGRWSREQAQWLKNLRQLSAQFHFDHITEHFGFFTGQNFHHGAPLSIPYTSTTLRIGRDRLLRIQDACQRPVGLENLAFSYSLDDVKQHGEFLEKLIAPANGFIILDLHNLYCQLHNFSVSYKELIRLYPLERVREIHISGGSWEEAPEAPGQKVRRDTHDDAVPAAVFGLLEQTMPLCPNLKYVVLEQLGNGLKTESSRAGFQRDFRQLEQLVQQANAVRTGHQPANLFLPLNALPGSAVEEDEALHQQQVLLSQILENAPSYQEAQRLLQTSSLAHSDWRIENWQPYMLETAIRIAQKWKK